MSCKCKEVKEELKDLRHRVWMMDVPHPTLPVYREWHEKVQTIMG